MYWNEDELRAFMHITANENTSITVYLVEIVEELKNVNSSENKLYIITKFYVIRIIPIKI